MFISCIFFHLYEGGKIIENVVMDSLKRESDLLFSQEILFSKTVAKLFLMRRFNMQRAVPEFMGSNRSMAD